MAYNADLATATSMAPQAWDVELKHYAYPDSSQCDLDEGVHASTPRLHRCGHGRHSNGLLYR